MLKALANKDTLLRTQMFPLLPARATVVSEFVQKYFVSPTNVSQFARARKRHDREQQCFRNNVPSFATALSYETDRNSGIEHIDIWNIQT